MINFCKKTSGSLSKNANNFARSFGEHRSLLSRHLFTVGKKVSVVGRRQGEMRIRLELKKREEWKISSIYF
jgi:hypothetical protein